ncbi:hypothetical protein M758_6G163400 [Ceratodon purpureus]|nr:hypothetical protein M758_6G163400 [Ceratodon purpureus]
MFEGLGVLVNLSGSILMRIECSSGSGIGIPPTWWCGFSDHDMDHGYPLWSLGPSWRVKANLHNQLICLPTAAQCVDFGDSFGGWNSMILNVEPQLSLTYFKEFGSLFGGSDHFL